MPLKIPTSPSEVVNRSKTDVQRELNGSNPFLRNHWLGAIVTALSLRVFDWYLQLQEAIKQAFSHTATGSYLDDHAAAYGLTRNAAVGASGNVIATGVAGTTIPVLTQYVASDGQTYTSTAAATITATQAPISSITRSGSIVTVVTAQDHNLSNNIVVTISGADQPEYNVTNQEITITAVDEFTFTIPTTPVTPATGTLLLDHTSIPVPLSADDYGIATNQVAGTELSLVAQIVNVEDVAGVPFEEIGGGTDIENDDDLQSRLSYRKRNPVAHFNVADIVTKAKEVPGVTRVFVQEITPGRGQVTVYFMRDNDDDPIPAAIEVTAVKTKLLTIKPAMMSDSDLIVSAPTAVPVNFQLQGLDPNTVTMQAAIEANLAQFFTDKPEVGIDILQKYYEAAVTNTVDPDTGDTVNNYLIVSPSGDIVISTGEIATLGTVTWL